MMHALIGCGVVATVVTTVVATVVVKLVSAETVPHNAASS